MVIRIYKFCSVSRALSTLTRTLGKSAKFVTILVVLFFVAAFGFALSTTLILGQDNAVFSSTAVAMFTLLRAGFGDFDYTEWPTSLGQILLVAWLLFSNSFLLNIVVAVICEAFVEVTEENKEAQEAVRSPSSSHAAQPPRSGDCMLASGNLRDRGGAALHLG